jgi:7,8-dihydro-6-hydroxymethylpterin dimethyltransferase
MVLISPEQIMNPDPKFISTTESLCPECLGRIPADLIQRNQNTYLRKTCTEHGTFETVIWRGSPAYDTWEMPKIPTYPEKPFTTGRLGCPYDCGLCPDHRQQPCCVLLEVTQRCDLGCPLCFANAGGSTADDPDLSTIRFWFQNLITAGGPFNIQLSGGEPCLREDLPEIIALGKSLGFTFFQVNTNGLRLATDIDFLKKLKDVGLSTVYLQFDGTHDAIYEKIRGHKLLWSKIAAIKNCAELQLGVVLVATIVPGINSSEVGNIIKLALQYHPMVRGVHFQPVSYFGRYPLPPQNEDRITLPEVITLLEVQTERLVKKENFKPSGGENAHCSFHGNFVVMPDGSLKPLSRHEPDACCCKPMTAQEGRIKAQAFVSRIWTAPPADAPTQTNIPGLGEWDTFLNRARTHAFSISGMAFQDSWTVDLARLRDCYILTVAPDGKLVPFCAYNLTSLHGEALYRGNGR